MTNFEKIKALDAEELAEFLYNIYKYNEDGKSMVSVQFGHNGEGFKEIQETCEDIKEWLESEVE